MCGPGKDGVSGRVREGCGQVRAAAEARWAGGGWGTAGRQRPGRDSGGLAGHAGMDLSQLRERGAGARGHFFG
jgi:hypothetical protein